jgi:UDP-N-acetyl-D-mannosaminuronate dehydrogenase
LGLPLAVEFGKKFETIGYGLSEQQIASYKSYCDPTGEVSFEDLKAAQKLSFTTDPTGISKADFIFKEGAVLIDVKSKYDRHALVRAGFRFWRL